MEPASKTKLIDSHRKMPRHLTEASPLRAGLSILAAFALILLLGMKLNDYLKVNTSTSVAIDKSSDGDFLQISFNISFPALSCEFASADVTDVLGTNRLNIKKSVRKHWIDSDATGSEPTFPPNRLNIKKIVRKHWIDSNNPIASEFQSGPSVEAIKHDDGVDKEYEESSVTLNGRNFDVISHKFAILVVKFHQPWCEWSKRLKPHWEETAKIITGRYDPNIDGRILLGEVDCSEEPDLCRRHEIQAYPDIRIFRHGSDIMPLQRERNTEFEHYQDHESYYGDRDTESLVKFVDDLVASIPTVHKYWMDSNLNPTSSEFKLGSTAKVIKHYDGFDEEYEEGSVTFNRHNFDRISHKHPILVVNFYAPWCQWSKRLKPHWEETAKIIRERYDPNVDGRILLGEVDCTEESALCRRHGIQGYPSIRIFRNGSDIMPLQRERNTRSEHYQGHESYHGDRDTESLVKFVEDLLASVPTVRKYSVDSNSNPTSSEFESATAKAINLDDSVDGEYEEGSVTLNRGNFDGISHKHAILVVKFYVPWCYWSNRLKRPWEETAKIIRERYDPNIDGRILLGEVDCTEETDLCRRHEIQGYPSVRIFKNGSDIMPMQIQGNTESEHYQVLEHESYYGERDTESLVKFVEDLVAPIPLPPRRLSNSLPAEINDDMEKPAPKTSGCRIEGFVRVNKVPGRNLIISARSAIPRMRKVLHDYSVLNSVEINAY